MFHELQNLRLDQQSDSSFQYSIFPLVGRKVIWIFQTGYSIAPRVKTKAPSTSLQALGLAPGFAQVTLLWEGLLGPLLP